MKSRYLCRRSLTPLSHFCFNNRVLFQTNSNNLKLLCSNRSYITELEHHPYQHLKPRVGRSQNNKEFKNTPRYWYDRRITHEDDPRDPEYNISRTTHKFKYESIYPRDPPGARFDLKDKNHFLPPVLSKRFRQSRMLLTNNNDAFNALNYEMVKTLSAILQKWDEFTFQIGCIFLSTSGDHLCAGIDYKDLFENLAKGDKYYHREFIGELYQLMFNITNLNTPFAPIIKGYTLGAGAAMVFHSPIFKIATEEAVLGFPNISIGLIPDCGATYYLSRLPNNLGVYLALTGKHIKGVDLVHAGIATHYIPTNKHSTMFTWLETEGLEAVPLDATASLLSYFCEPIEEYEYKLKNTGRLDIIQTLFEPDSIQKIYARVEAASKYDDWAKSLFNRMKKFSPKSLFLTLQALKIAQNMELKDCMMMEYRVTMRLLEEEDFFNGCSEYVMKRNVDFYAAEEKVDWDIKSVYDIKDENKLLKQYFSSLGSEYELSLEKISSPKSQYKTFFEEGLYSPRTINELINCKKFSPAFDKYIPEDSVLGEANPFSKDVITSEAEDYETEFNTGVDLNAIVNNFSDKELVELLKELIVDSSMCSPDEFYEFCRQELTKINSLPPRQKIVKLKELVVEMTEYTQGINSVMRNMVESKETDELGIDDLDNTDILTSGEDFGHYNKNDGYHKGFFRESKL